MDQEPINNPPPLYSKTALRRDRLGQPDRKKSKTEIPEDGHPDEIEDILFTLEEDDQ